MACSKMKCNTVKCLLETKTQNGVANEEVSPINGRGKGANKHAQAIKDITVEDSLSNGA